MNISKRDAVGRRFNNLEAASAIARKGWDCAFCTWEQPESGYPCVFRAESPLGSFIEPLAIYLEYRTGCLDTFYRNARTITHHPAYRAADLLHFHIVHERWLAAADWIRLARGKPVVWTWHDPYLMTGHCLYPLDCTGFESGCEKCEHLDYHFPIRRDRARRNLRRKALAVNRIDPLVIVASEYMADMVRRSVYGGRIRVKVIPFGVQWPTGQDRLSARKSLGIPAHHIVFGFRAIHSAYKGLGLVQTALAHLAGVFPSAPITIIAFQERGTLSALCAEWQLIETGWIADSRIAQYYAAMDFFLMPSRAEAFGLMAVEALAAGAVPVVTYGTALPELVAVPVHAIGAEPSSEGLAEAVVSAVRNCRHWATGAADRQRFAREHFSLEAYASRIASAYDEEYEHYARHGRLAGR